MNPLLILLDKLLNQLRTLVVSKNAPTVVGQKLYETSLTFIGQDSSPKDIAPDEYGCVESLEQVYFKAFGEYIGGGVSTLRLYYALVNNKKFVKVTSPIAGDIILSPTSMNTEPSNVKNGHCGVVGQNGRIMSNSSASGKWESNYDLFTWRSRWVKNTYPLYFFRKVL